MGIVENAYNEEEKKMAIALEERLLKVVSRTGLEEIVGDVKKNAIEYPLGTNQWLDRVVEEYDIAMDQNLTLKKLQTFDPIYYSGVNSFAVASMKTVLEKASQSKIRRGINTITNFVKASKKDFKRDWQRIKDRFTLSR